MKISFDLDGFVAEGGHRWFFRVLDAIRKIDSEMAELAELEFYSSRALKYHPNFFLSKNDNGFIITCRKPKAKCVTESWLRRYGVTLPIIFVDAEGEIDWRHSYNQASVRAAQLKAKAIRELQIEVHFDNNTILVDALRKELPEVKIILVGSEE